MKTKIVDIENGYKGLYVWVDNSSWDIVTFFQRDGNYWKSKTYPQYSFNTVQELIERCLSMYKEKHHS